MAVARAVAVQHQCKIVGRSRSSVVAAKETVSFRIADEEEESVNVAPQDRNGNKNDKECDCA